MGRLGFGILVAVLTLLSWFSWCHGSAVGAIAQLPPRPVIFIPTLYVTSLPERANPNQVFIYQADICNVKLYIDLMVVVRVNIPAGWKPGIGYLAKLEVCGTSTCNKILCSNYVQGVFNGQHNCSLAYNTTMEHIFVRATAGPAPNMDWTIAVEFLPKREYFATRVEDVMYYDVPEPIGENKVSPNAVKVLSQIIPPGVHQSVTTLNRLDFIMTFCPDSTTTQRYNIDIVVTALDSRSAMATYVCLPPLQPGGCTPISATHSDPRGIAINVVTLQTGSATLKDIYVDVVGWGDGEQENNFLIGATISKY